MQKKGIFFNENGVRTSLFTSYMILFFYNLEFCLMIRAIYKFFQPKYQINPLNSLNELEEPKKAENYQNNDKEKNKEKNDESGKHNFMEIKQNNEKCIEEKNHVN